MRKMIYISVLVLLVSISMGGDLGGGAGKFMLLGQTPRGISRGQAMVAAPMLEAFSYNPATIIGMEGYQALASYQHLALDRTIYAAAFGANLHNDAAFSFSWTHAGVDIQGRNRNGEITGDLRNGMDNIAVAFSKRIYKGFAAGASVRYYQERLSELHSYTAGFDAGVVYHQRELGLRFGFAVYNFNMVNTWDSSELYRSGTLVEEEFPVSARLGSFWQMNFLPADISADISLTENRDIRYHFGASYTINDYFALTAGLDYDLPTAGLSLTIPVTERIFVSADYTISAERWDLPWKHIIGIRGYYDTEYWARRMSD